jgi:hypothetical protein
MVTTFHTDKYTVESPLSARTPSTFRSALLASVFDVPPVAFFRWLLPWAFFAVHAPLECLGTGDDRGDSCRDEVTSKSVVKSGGKSWYRGGKTRHKCHHLVENKFIISFNGISSAYTDLRRIFGIIKAKEWVNGQWDSSHCLHNGPWDHSHRC